MKSLLLSFLLLALLAGCAKRQDGFQPKLESLRHGMTKTQVEALLAKPSFVDTPTNDPFKTRLAGIAEVWEYWTDAQGNVLQHQTGHQQGSACFDAAGQLQYAWAGYREVVAPVRYPIGKELVAHYKDSLLEIYKLKASRGELANPASPDKIWFSTLPTDYVYPDYSNATYTVGIEVKTAMGNTVTYEAEMSREPNPWKRTWTFKFNAAEDPKGNMLRNQTNF
jgi:hypothetical protein